jgi:adenylate kinase family enzyme
MIFFFLGPPCSGKSSIARGVGIPYLSTGDIARELAETDEETRDALASGEMAPSHKMDLMVLAKLRPLNTTEHLAVDGYPRYMEQLADLYARFAPENMRFVVVHALISVVLERSKNRARPGETFPVIMRRHQDYCEQTGRVIDYLRFRCLDFLLELNTSEIDIETGTQMVRAWMDESIRPRWIGATHA